MAATARNVGCPVLRPCVHVVSAQHLRLDRDNIGEVQREAKTMAKLRGHPNILRLHAVAFAGPKGSETDGFFLLDYCVSVAVQAVARPWGDVGVHAAVSASRPPATAQLSSLAPHSLLFPLPACLPPPAWHAA